jgi:D-arabinose 5-phosphate isomerase GutQ
MRTPEEIKKILEEVNVGELFHEALMAISKEIEAVALLVKDDPKTAYTFIEAIIDTLLKEEDIYVRGVGRSGSIGDMWALRAMTILGRKKVFIIGEKTTPKVIGGLLLAITGSGSTIEIVKEIEKAIEEKSGTKIFAVTSTPGSPAWELAHLKVNLGGAKNDPMFSLRTSPEIRAFGFLEASNIVLRILFNTTNEEMSGRHP